MKVLHQEKLSECYPYSKYTFDTLFTYILLVKDLFSYISMVVDIPIVKTYLFSIKIPC